MLYIFDLDGTLIDSAADIQSAANHMLEEVGAPPLSLDETISFIGKGSRVLVERCLNHRNIADIDAKKIDACLERFLAHYMSDLTSHTTIYPGVIEGLNALKKANHQIALCTNKPEAPTREILKSLDLEKYFEMVIGGDSLAQRKPDPLPILHICNELGVAIENSVMVGDSDSDILAANGAHMKSIWVTYGYNHGNVADLKPTYRCANFVDILALEIK